MVSNFRIQAHVYERVMWSHSQDNLCPGWHYVGKCRSSKLVMQLTCHTMDDNIAYDSFFVFSILLWDSISFQGSSSMVLYVYNTKGTSKVTYIASGNRTIVYGILIPVPWYCVLAYVVGYYTVKRQSSVYRVSIYMSKGNTRSVTKLLQHQNVGHSMCKLLRSQVTWHKRTQELLLHLI